MDDREAEPAAMRDRLQELLEDVRAVDTQLPAPLTLCDSIAELEQTLELYQRCDPQDK